MSTIAFAVKLQLLSVLPFPFVVKDWQVRAFLCLMLVGGPSGLLHGQASTSSSKLLPARDATAVATIQSAIDAMGGNAFWSTIHGVTVTGTYVKGDDPKSISFTWTDDWHTGIERLLRDNGTLDGTHRSLYLQDAPSSNAAISRSSSSRSTAANSPRKPRFDLPTGLIAHLPAAALYAALQDPAYGVSRTPPPASAAAKTNCVRIRGITSAPDSRSDPSDIIVCFSEKTHLPVSAYIGLTDLFNPGHHSIELVQYVQFQTLGNAAIPAIVTSTNPARKSKTLSITSVSWNPALSDSTFRSAQ